MGDSLGTYVQHVGGAGLVYNVTEYLFGHGINIENLETRTEEVSTSNICLLTCDTCLLFRYLVILS
jgi:glycine cleavage system regulatory protein